MDTLLEAVMQYMRQQYTHRCPSCGTLVGPNVSCCGNLLQDMLLLEALEGGFGPGIGGGGVVGEMLEIEGILTGNPLEVLEGEILREEGF